MTAPIIFVSFSAISSAGVSGVSLSQRFPGIFPHFPKKRFRVPVKGFPAYVSGNLRAYDILIDETDPDLLDFEFDSYWFADGGVDAGRWMKRLGSRMKLWHINDRGYRKKGPFMTPILKCDSMELGTGNMDLDSLYSIALDSSTEAVVLESHRNWTGKDPIMSLTMSAEWLNAK